jgi:AraC-like DNA-binding protein
LHVGIAQGDTSPTPLPARYRGALWAAERALSQGIGVAHATQRQSSSGEALRELRSEIGESIKERSTLLSPRFDRYIEAVLAHVGYRIERAQGELSAGLERVTEPLLAAGLIQRRSYSEMFALMEERAEAARTVDELVHCYRSHVTELQAALTDPSLARQERGTQRAVTFMNERYGEPLTMAKVARVAGFAPDYFCRLFKRDQGTTPELYLLRLRVNRAKEMLLATKLGTDAVRKLCGFQTRAYFQRAFKKLEGTTPGEFRASAGLSGAQPHSTRSAVG